MRLSLSILVEIEKKQISGILIRTLISDKKVKISKVFQITPVHFVSFFSEGQLILKLRRFLILRLAVSCWAANN